MTAEEIYKTCKLLHATHYLPIACFTEDGASERLYCSYPGYGAIFSVMAQKAPKNETVSLVSGHAGLYGIVRIPQNELLIVTGPFVNRHIDDGLFDILLHDYQIAWEEREILKQFLLSLPRHSLNRFLNFLALMHYLFNGEELAVTDYFKNAFPALQNEIGARHSEEILKETDFSHGTYGFEQQLLSYVSAGDVAGIHAFFDAVARSTPMTEGKLAEDTLRQSKNIFIGLICMVGKVGAIRGNLDIEQTYQLMYDGLSNRKAANRNEEKANVFVKDKYESAAGFIKMLRQRQETLFNTMQAIVNWQRDFFLSDDEAALKPMVLKDISAITGYDISVISRATAGKYVSTQRGIYPIKFFFNEGLKHESGEDVSSREIQKELKNIIEAEDKKKPLSDEIICKMLQQKGYEIARRTIAKYREKLGYPVARLRKEL